MGFPRPSPGAQVRDYSKAESNTHTGTHTTHKGVLSQLSRMLTSMSRCSTKYLQDKRRHVAPALPRDAHAAHTTPPRPPRPAHLTSSRFPFLHCRNNSRASMSARGMSSLIIRVSSFLAAPERLGLAFLAPFRPPCLPLSPQAPPQYGRFSQAGQLFHCFSTTWRGRALLSWPCSVYMLS